MRERSAQLQNLVLWCSTAAGFSVVLLLAGSWAGYYELSFEACALILTISAAIQFGLIGMRILVRDPVDRSKLSATFLLMMSAAIVVYCTLHAFSVLSFTPWVSFSLLFLFVVASVWDKKPR